MSSTSAKNVTLPKSEQAMGLTYCCGCHSPIGMLRSWLEKAKEVGRMKFKLYCPYCGLRQGWVTPQPRGKTLAQVLAETEANLAEVHQLLTDEREASKSLRRRLRKVESLGRKKFCPCCDRLYLNLKKHIQNKHPEYKLPE